MFKYQGNEVFIDLDKADDYVGPSFHISGGDALFHRDQNDLIPPIYMGRILPVTNVEGKYIGDRDNYGVIDYFFEHHSGLGVCMMYLRKPVIGLSSWNQINSTSIIERGECYKSSVIQ